MAFYDNMFGGSTPLLILFVVLLILLLYCIYFLIFKATFLIQIIFGMILFAAGYYYISKWLSTLASTNQEFISPPSSPRA